MELLCYLQKGLMIKFLKGCKRVLYLKYFHFPVVNKNCAFFTQISVIFVYKMTSFRYQCCYHNRIFICMRTKLLWFFLFTSSLFIFFLWNLFLCPSSNHFSQFSWYSQIDLLRTGEDKKLIAQHVEAFAKEGLRTLCLASKKLDPQEFAAWKKILHKAENDMDDRQVFWVPVKFPPILFES